MEILPSPSSVEYNHDSRHANAEHAADWLIEHATLSPNSTTELQIERKHETVGQMPLVQKSNNKPMVPLGLLIKNHPSNQAKTNIKSTKPSSNNSVKDDDIFNLSKKAIPVGVVIATLTALLLFISKNV